MKTDQKSIYRIYSCQHPDDEIVSGRLFGEQRWTCYNRIPVSYATVYAHGECRIEIHVEEDIESFLAWPRRDVLEARVEKRKIVLAAARPCNMVVRVNKLENLLLTFSGQAAKVDTSRGIVVRAEDYGILPEKGNMLTEKINTAISSLSGKGGGTLVFPPGIYLTGTVNMSSGVFIHLQAGAILMGSEKPSDYPEDDENNIETGLPQSLIPGSRRGLIYCLNIENAGIEGAGVVCGNGSFIRSGCKRRPLINLLRAVKSRNLSFEGVYLVDSEFWSVHLVLCEDISFTGTKIISEIPPRGWDSFRCPGSLSCWNNADGINPDSSRNVRVEGCIIHTGDDSLPIKNTGIHRNILRNCENIEVRNCLMISSTTAMKIGTESRGEHIRNACFENIDIFQASRGIGLDLKDGAEASGIVFRNINIRRCNRPLDIWVIPREDQIGQKYFSRIRNVLIENMNIEEYRCEGIGYESHVYGHSDKNDVKNITFKRIWLAGQPVKHPSQAHIQTNDFAKDILFCE